MISIQLLKKKLLNRINGKLIGARTRELRELPIAQANIHPMARLGSDGVIKNLRGFPEAINVGPHSVINGELYTSVHGGKIRLGSYCFLGPGSRIWSATSVNIGDYVLISHNVNIHDNDSHSLESKVRRKHAEFILDNDTLPDSAFGAAEAPVEIEDDVWICFNSSILKGVRIGRGAVIAAGSVVTRDVEPYTLVAGNPARFKRKLDPDK